MEFWNVPVRSVLRVAPVADSASHIPHLGNVSGANSWSFQKMRLAGGCMTLVSATISMFIDQVAANDFRNKRLTGLAVAYQARVVVGGVAALSGAFTTYTFTAPLIARALGRGAVRGAAVVVSEEVLALVACRIMSMVIGFWATLALFAIDIVIVVITPTALQEWCRMCAFSANKTGDAYRTVGDQEMGLKLALAPSKDPSMLESMADGLQGILEGDPPSWMAGWH